jgi:DNA (cytosine-5)-methyltransferase 1
MTLVDLFAGAGGASLGAHAAGFEVEAVELDADAVATHRAALPGVVHHCDVKEWHPSGPVGVVWASPPCQCWSSAGKRLGARDKARNGFPWTWAAVDRAAPRWLVIENVPALTHHSRRHCGDPNYCPGCYWREVVLPAARARFACVTWRIVNAADHGVPQTRRRVFLVAGPRPYTWPTPTHCDPSDPLMLAAGRRPWVSTGAALGVARVIGGGGNPHGKGRPHERNYRDLTGGPCVTIAASHVGNRGPWVCTTTRRRLTLAERATLQAFPADYPWGGATKSSIYRQIGNAVPPPVAEALLRNIPREESA